MYVPTHFAASDADVAELLGSLSAADLVTPTSAGLVATFLPLLHDAERGSLVGHVARNNDHWRVEPLGESLVVVRGPDAYVSPSWYASKREHGRVVPTWNYTTAHVHGELVVHHDQAWLEDVVRRLTDVHEAGSAQPWSVDDAPPAFVAGQLRAIVGVELRITRIEAKVKLSQNRPAADVDGVVAGLEARGDTASAQAVRRARR
jgi:transcriptional regulator